MPRNAQGVYYLPASNPVVEGTIIEATWANETMDDIAAQLNNVLTADGTVGPTGPFLFADGTAAAPGIAFSAQPATGIYRYTDGSVRISLAGSQAMAVGTYGLSLPGLTKRFYADMSDADPTQRFSFVTNQTDKNTVLQIAPNGAGDPAGAGSALLAISDLSDPANYYAMAIGAGEFIPGQSRCAVRLYKVGTVPDVPLSMIVDDQTMMSFWENSVITVGDHTPAPWTTSSTYSLKLMEIGKAGWSIGSNTVATADTYSISTVCNAYSDGTNWRLAANNPYGSSKASASLFVMRGDQSIFALNTNTGQTAGSVVAWSPSMVIDWGTLGDNKVGVYGQVRAYQFVATDSV
jgi:hypothetical protein